MKTKNISNNLSDFWVISNDFVTRIFRAYILTKNFEKFMKTKNLIFKTI